MSSSRGVLPPRDASEIRAGYQSGAEYLRQFRRAIFGNSGFHCYTNAVMRCILWNMHDLEEARESFGEALHEAIQGVWQTDVFHFWRHPTWQEAMVGWRSPDQQHDVGEFLRHLLDLCPGLSRNFTFTWEARRVNGSELEAVQILDAATSVLLILDSNVRDAHGQPLESVSLQQMLHAWECQESTHGFCVTPERLAILAGRFHMERGRLRKRHLHIIPNERIYVPTYDGAVFHTSGYLLNSYVEHEGEDLHTGHYTAVLRDQHEYWKANDNVPISRMSELQKRGSHSRSYLFFYSRIQS